MDDILAYLEDITFPETLPPEYFDLVKLQAPYMDAIQQQLSLRFLDDFIDAQCEEFKWQRREAFARGFRLGVQVILAAEPASPSTRRRSWAYQ